MQRILDARKAKELTGIVEALSGAASFRRIMHEAVRAGVLRRHETLRRYLDLLVKGKVLRVRTRDVGSVNLQQLYTVHSRNPEVWVGLAVLRRHGLNWEVPETEMRPILTDFDGLVRSKVLDGILMASPEDCLIQELRRDVSERSGATSFVIAIISTRALDLPYLLRRADEMHMGTTLRLLFNRILEVVSSREIEVAGKVFIAVREHFLEIARRYSQSGFWKLVDEKGVGSLGLRTVSGLSEHEIIVPAGKQLGVAGW